MNKYVDVFEINKRGKKREIVSYKDNKDGMTLRKKHNKLLCLLDAFPSSSLSYAYKKETATKDAFENHL